MPPTLKDERDYGRFISSGLFRNLFPNYNIQQAQAAKELVSRVFSQCHGKFDFPEVETIVDLGCGNGAFLIGIKRAIDDYNRGITEQFRIPVKRYLGLDISRDVIRQAALKSRSLRPSVQFEAATSEVLGLRSAFTKQGVKGESAALLILSHTWFHFQNQEALLAEIDRLRPALILLDIFHSWDATLNTLNHSHSLDEPISTKGGVFVLRTEREGKSEVSRGVYEVGRGKGSGQWRFHTTQTRIGTDWLFGAAKDLDELSKARGAGRLTGARAGQEQICCDYVRCQKFLYLTGWGFMDCHVLLAIDPNARLLNEAFYQVLANIVRKHFLDGPIQEQLNFFKNPHKPIPRCEVAIIQPFDRNRAFARFVKLNKAQDDAEISKHDTILELPERSQRNYPTAYGLYHTMLCRVSSMQASPLAWAPNYEHAEVDLQFSALENDLLGLDEDDKDPSFFIVPIYFGSLPLLALIVESPANMSAENADPFTYQQTLLHLHKQIKDLFDDDFLLTQVLSPFIARSLDALEKASTIIPGSTISPSSGGVGEHLELIRAHVEQALAKNWKSWILSIPSQPINKLKSVISENKRLRKLLDQEETRFSGNPELPISYWFEKGRFFEACDCKARGIAGCSTNQTAHEEWCRNTHPTRLKEMFALIDGCVGDIASSPYFARCAGSYLLAWASRTLTSLETAQSRAEKTQIYKDLKAVFCRTMANHGRGVRFSTRRLYCVLKAASETAISQQSKTLVEFHPTNSEAVDGMLAADNDKMCSDSDPTTTLGDFLSPLAQLDLVKRVTFERKSPQEIEICITLSRELYDDNKGGGEDFACAQNAWERLSPSLGRFYGLKIIRIPIRVCREAGNLAFTPKALPCYT